jgi:hypothetical protein
MRDLYRTIHKWGYDGGICCSKDIEGIFSISDRWQLFDIISHKIVQSVSDDLEKRYET